MTRFDCPVCGEEHRTAGAVHDHAWTVHGACHYCGETFDDEATLYVHWLATHDGELSRVDRKRAKADIDELTVGDRLVHHGPGTAVTGLSRRTLLLAGGAAIAGGATAVGTTLTGDSPSDKGHRTVTSESGTGMVATAPVPPSPADHRYAVAGRADTDVTVTYFGSWKCPYCARFSTGFLATLVSDYIEPGKITLEFRDLAYINGEPFLGADAPAAGQAGLAVWNSAPASYWRYHEVVMANQPPERKRWATADRLVSFAEQAGVPDPSVVRNAVQERTYADALRATATAAAEAGIRGTPMLLIDGTAVSPFEKDRTRRRIEATIA